MELNMEHFKETVRTEEVMYLATSADDVVTVRTVSPLLRDDLTVYFYTSCKSQKYQQMKKNSNVAFTIGVNGCYQAQGTVRFLGSVFAEENAELNAVYRNKYEGAFVEAAPGEDMQSNEFMAIDIKMLKGWIFGPENPMEPIGVGEKHFA